MWQEGKLALLAIPRQRIRSVGSGFRVPHQRQSCSCGGMYFLPCRNGKWVRPRLSRIRSTGLVWSTNLEFSLDLDWGTVKVAGAGRWR